MFFLGLKIILQYSDFKEWNLIEAPNDKVENDHGVIKHHLSLFFVLLAWPKRTKNPRHGNASPHMPPPARFHVLPPRPKYGKFRKPSVETFYQWISSMEVEFNWSSKPYSWEWPRSGQILVAPGEVRNPGLKEIRLLVSRAGFTFRKGRYVREDGNGFFYYSISPNLIWLWL